MERTENELDAAVRAFSGLDDVDAARERLAALRDARDAARDRLDELQAAVLPAVTLTADDWDLLTLAERRDLIRAVVDRAVVTPGRGDDADHGRASRAVAAPRHGRGRAARRRAPRGRGPAGRSRRRHSRQLLGGWSTAGATRVR